MAIDPALQALAPHTVNIANRTGVDAFNKPTYSADVEYDCLIEYKPRMVRTMAGQEKVSGAAIYLTSAPGITTDDRVTLPDGTKPQILSIGRWPNLSGDYFECIYV
jgi:hypothetical protein